MKKKTIAIITICAVTVLILAATLAFKAKGPEAFNDWICKAQDDLGSTSHFHVPNFDKTKYDCPTNK